MRVLDYKVGQNPLTTQTKSRQRPKFRVSATLFVTEKAKIPLRQLPEQAIIEQHNGVAVCDFRSEKKPRHTANSTTNKGRLSMLQMEYVAPKQTLFPVCSHAMQ